MKKIINMKIHFLTFASSDWVNSPIRFKNDLQTINDNYKFFYTSSIWNENNLSQEYKNRFLKYKNDHGFAYFSWKPYCLIQKLNEIDNGDFIFYIDSGCVLPMNNIKSFIDDISTSINYMITRKIWMGISTYIDRNPNIKIPNVGIVKLEILQKFNLQNNTEFLFNYPHYQAGIFLLQKSQESIDFINKWCMFFDNNYEECIRGGYTDRTGQSRFFIHNGSDQAVLQCLMYENNINPYNINFIYNYNLIQHRMG